MYRILHTRTKFSTMKNLAIVGLFLATVSALPTQSAFDDLVKRKDDNCEIEWVTVYAREPAQHGGNPATGTEGSGNNASPTQPAASDSPSSAPQSSSQGTSGGNSTAAGSVGSGGPSALNLPNLPNGQPPIPLNEDYIKAPQPTDPVPDDAYWFNPSQEGHFNALEFQQWQKQFQGQQDNSSIAKSRWMKIKPGNYYWDLAAMSSTGVDPNTLEGFTITVYNQRQDWTLDIRGCTFYMDVTAQNKDHRGDTAFYFIQSTGLTVLGGTFWIDQGELFTQARVTSVTGTVEAGDLKATFKVEEGYELAPWRNAGPRNQGCADDSNPDTVTRPECNFWWVNDYKFDSLDSDRTFTAHLNDLKTSGIKVGLVVTMIAGPDGTPDVMRNEDNGSLTVKGLTTNAGIMSIGVNAGQTPPHYVDVYYVEPPRRPGFAPRLVGPGLSFGNKGPTYYNAPGAPEATFSNCWYQASSNPKDLIATSLSIDKSLL